MYVQKTPWVVTLWSPCEEAANTRGRQEERREFQSCWKTTSSVKLEAADLQTTCWKNRLRPSLARSSQCFATYRLKLKWCCSVSLWNNKLTPECVGDPEGAVTGNTPDSAQCVHPVWENTATWTPMLTWDVLTWHMLTWDMLTWEGLTWDGLSWVCENPSLCV